MRLRGKSIVAMFVLLIIAAYAPNLFAVTINVSIDGTAVACPASSSPCDTWFDLSTASLPGGTPYTITSSSSGTAKIVVDDVTGHDTLKLENTVFTATSAFSGKSLHFWGTFNTPPTTSGGGRVNYWRRATGQFIKTGGSGAPIGARLSVAGKVKGQVVVSTTTYTVPCNACGSFTMDTTPNFLQFSEPSNPLNTSHEIRAEMTNFKLNSAGDKLQLNEFKVWSTTGAGEDDGYENEWGTPCGTSGLNRCRDLGEDCPLDINSLDLRLKLMEKKVRILEQLPLIERRLPPPPK